MSTRQPRPAAQSRSGARAQRRRVGLVAAVLVLAVALGVAVRMRLGPAGHPSSLDLPPLPPSAPTVALADFAGSEACAACHAAEHAAWRGSTHGRAGGAPDQVALLRAFDGRPIAFRDARVTPRREAASYAFVVEWEDRPREVLPVDGVIGGGHMIGGGTQGFVTRSADGTVRFLPFELTRQGNAWFCNTNTRLDSGWLPITASLSLADCGDWPPVRVLGSHARLATCQECHGSQIAAGSEARTPGVTSYQSLDINCESCHGPARAHVEAARQPDASDLAMPSLALLGRDASLEVCFRCHALKDALRPGYLPGRPFEDYYSLLLPLLDETAPVFADGRIRTFAYQQGHLWSDCYVSGSMTCTDCHDPHAQGYRDANGHALAGRFADGQCTACHPSKAARIETHTRHAAESAGSRCVACHMPYVQEPEAGTRVPYARSDHVIPVPRPATDAGLGIEVACQACHRNRSPQELDASVAEWWGELKPVPGAVRSLLARERGEGAAIDSLIAAPPARAAAVEFMALSVLLRDRLAPDMATPDRRVLERLRAAATSGNADLAAIGLAALHYAAASDRATRQFLERRAAGLGGAATAVRRRWAVLLGDLADRHRTRGEWDAAIATYYKALNVLPSESATRMNLGQTFAGRGQPDSAEIAYRQSLRDDPRNTLALVNLGILLAARGDEPGAIQAYELAVQIDPYDGLAWFNLGNVHLRAGRAVDAARAYARAVELGPALPNAYYNYARALINLGRLDDARIALKNGLAYRPDSTAVAALRELDSARNR